MSKTIKVSEEVYNKLQEFQEKRESYSEAIGRVLVLVEKMGELKDILEGGVKFDAWRLQQRREEETPQR